MDQPAIFDEEDPNKREGYDSRSGDQHVALRERVRLDDSVASSGTDGVAEL